MRDMRLFAYILIISFQVQTVIAIGTEIVTGRAGETTLYRGFSLVWSLLALFALKAMYEMWTILGDVTKDIKALKRKKHLKGINEPTSVFGGFPPPPIEPIYQEEIERLNLLEKILEKKIKNEPSN